MLREDTKELGVVTEEEEEVQEEGEGQHDKPKRGQNWQCTCWYGVIGRQFFVIFTPPCAHRRAEGW